MWHVKVAFWNNKWHTKLTIQNKILDRLFCVPLIVLDSHFHVPLIVPDSNFYMTITDPIRTTNMSLNFNTWTLPKCGLATTSATACFIFCCSGAQWDIWPQQQVKGEIREHWALPYPWLDEAAKKRKFSLLVTGPRRSSEAKISFKSFQLPKI